MNVNNPNSNWRWLELIGKFLILVSICFQLIIIGNTTTKSVEIERTDRQNSYNLESSNHMYLAHLVESQGLETQLVALQNQLMLVQMTRFSNVIYGGDKQALIETDKSLGELTDEIVTANEDIYKHQAKIKERILKAASLAESSERLREDLKILRSKNNTDLNFLNSIFLIMFILGSILTLYARFLEMKIDKHPTEITDTEQTRISEESE